MLIMLTRDNCKYCNDFKSFLKFSPTGKKYGSTITILNQDHLESDQEAEVFKKYLDGGVAQGGQSFPFVLNEEGLLLTTGFNVTKATEVLKENAND